MAGKADDDLQRIADQTPDIASLQNVDYDHDHIALKLIQKRLKKLGHDMPYAFAARPNTGIDSGFDLDKNGKLGEPRDMLGYGRFTGQGGMVVLSRHPILVDQNQDFSQLLWADMDLPQLPEDGYYSSKVLDVLPLHSVGAWDVAVQLPDGLLHVLTSHASTPVFDGPEDRNGLRNAAELRFWKEYLERSDRDESRYVLLGTFNIDPKAGQGIKRPLLDLVNHTALQDPQPIHANGAFTAEWSSGLALRLDYVLPSHRFGIRATAVERALTKDGRSRHHPVWVDITW